MSAQAGIWNFDGEKAPHNLLQRLSASMAQHGPDGELSFVSSGPTMIYRPFFTTTLSRLERQPFVSPSSGVAFMWDGRLDNRDDLLNELHEPNHPQQTDVSIVLAAYDRWGTECFCKLRGDWALSLWDPSQQAVILARDYIGVRHLHYHLTSQNVVWSTHITPILSVCNCTLTLDDEYIAGYLSWKPDAHLTPYAEIASVPPGSFVRIGNRQKVVRSYWKFEARRRLTYSTDAQYEEHFRQLFRQAVKRRLRADSPVLAELSGGLDSSSIVCMADDIVAKEPGAPPRLDTISFYNTKEPSGDERPFFSKVEEKRLRVGHHFDAGDFPPCFSLSQDDFVGFPRSVRSTVSLDRLMNELMRREGYRVVLSGIGGDEFLGGAPDPRSQLGDLLFQCRLRELYKQTGAWSLAKRKPRMQLLTEAFLRALPPAIRSSFSEEGRVPLWIDCKFATRYDLSVRQLGPTGRFGFWLPSQREFAQTFSVVAQGLSSLPPSSVGTEERRYPYTDQDLIEFLVSIPASQLLRPGERRSLMRRALATILPTEVLNRKTKAVVARQYMVALNSNSAQLERLFETPLTAQEGYIDKTAFQKALLEAKHGVAPHLPRMMRVIGLELFMLKLTDLKLLRSHSERDVSTRLNIAAPSCGPDYSQIGFR
jgi:asparagine synthase (glutamine-hydrolysing)